MSTLPREYFLVIEHGEDKLYVGQVPQLRSGCSRGRVIDELMINIGEVTALFLEVAGQLRRDNLLGSKRGRADQPES